PRLCTDRSGAKPVSTACTLLAEELVEKVLHIRSSRFSTILDLIQGVLHLGLCRFPSFLNLLAGDLSAFDHCIAHTFGSVFHTTTDLLGTTLHLFGGRAHLRRLCSTGEATAEPEAHQHSKANHYTWHKGGHTTPPLRVQRGRPC